MHTEDPSNPPRDLHGRRISPYDIGAKIGAGGMGEVYKGVDTGLARTVAIKVLPAQLAHDPNTRERFEREARAVAALNHPNICTLYDVGTQEGLDYLVMEFLEGETLSARLARGPLPSAKAIQLGVQVASALNQAHRAGLVHRDLKPGNIFLVRGSGDAVTAKLLDFGLATASVAVRPGDETHTVAPNLTSAGLIVGTVQYMAPE